MSHKITTVWKDEMVFESDNPSGYAFNMGLTEEENDPSKPLRPKALMLSALAGCSGVDIIPMLEKMKVEIDDFKMEIEGQLTDETPKTYHTVIVDYHFTGKDLNEKKINRAVKLSTEKYCGVMEMFKKFAEIKVNVHFHNA